MARPKRTQEKVKNDDHVGEGEDIDMVDIEEEDGDFEPQRKRKKQVPGKAPRDVVKTSVRKRAAPVGITNEGGVAELDPDDTIVVDTCGLGPLSRFAPIFCSGNGESAIPRSGREQRVTPRSGEVQDDFPHRGIRESAIPRSGREQRATPRSGQVQDDFPRSGREQRSIPRSGEVQDDIPRSGKEPFVSKTSVLFDIDDEIVALLETDGDLADLWDETDQLDEPSDTDQLAELSEAGEPEKEPWVPKVWLDALLKCTDASPLGPAIREMLEWCIAHAEASEDVLKFLEEENPSTWCSHCKSMDKIWAKYAPEFARICECDEAMLSKPSGPLNATICVQWHYPTFNSSHLGYGMTFDPTNPCLKIQETKIGRSRRVLTIDTFPARTSKPEKGKELSDNFYYWTEYRDLAIQFQHEIARHSQLRIVLGKQNWLLVQEHLETQSDVIISRIPLFFTVGSRKETVSFYGKPVELLVVQAKATMAIEQIIIPSYHIEWLFHADSGYNRHAYMMDIMWNACAAIAGINTVNPGYFQWKIIRCASMPRNRVAKAIHMVQKEKEGRPIDEEIVRDEFSDWLSRNSGCLDPTKGSLARQILCAMSAKGRKTQAANGYQKLKKGRETNAANGYPSLKKGLKTNAANGYLNLKKARETQAANGYPGQKKWRETQAANGYQELKKGHETQSRAFEIKANAKWQALRNGPVLVWERSEKKSDRDRAKQYHELNSQSWQVRADYMKRWIKRKYFTWYGHKNPDGLRYEGNEDKDIPQE